MQPEAEDLVRSANHVIRLIMALAILAAVVLPFGSCGGDNLVFPGQEGPTVTPAPTATATPEEE